jgi:Zn-dependent metalloprotease
MPISAFADQAVPFVSSPASGFDALTKLQKAYETLKAQPFIQTWNLSGDHALLASQKISDEQMETTKFQDYFKGIEVVGSLSFHHESAQGVEVSNELASFDLDVTPSLTQEAVVSLARGIDGDKRIAGIPALKILPSDDNASARLVYWVSLQGASMDEEGSDLVIDAHTGSIIAHTSHWITFDLQPPKKTFLAPVAKQPKVDVYATNAGCQQLDPAGRPLGLSLLQCTQVVTNSQASAQADATAKRAMSNSSLTLDYYSKTHGRSSYDNAGSNLVNVVHVGKGFNNAFWSSQDNLMAYGDGDGKTFKNFTEGTDVAGHELTHGVTAHTAQLLYFGEYGALNEAYSDFFGKMIAGPGDWSMGKDLFIAGGQGVRNMANPGLITTSILGTPRPFPAHVKDQFETSDFCGATNDNCFVHVNSTIPSHAGYLVVQKIGREKAEKIYYRTLTQLLGPRTNFKAYAKATIKACTQLYGLKDPACAAVQQAMAEVGL